MSGLRRKFGYRLLARELGVSAAMVSKWRMRDDWPVKLQGPWSFDDVGTVREWCIEFSDKARDHYVAELRAEADRAEKELAKA